MPIISQIDHAVLMCHLAEYQDEVDAEIDNITHTDGVYDADKLARLLEKIDLRNAMKKVREHVGGQGK